MFTRLRLHVFLLTVLSAIIFQGCSKTEGNIEEEKPFPLPVGKPDSLHMDKPNIIFILSDDVGFEIPASNGGQSYSTPNFDRMSATGMRFTQCYASPMCAPSRTMLLTGKYNFRNYTAWGVLNQKERTIGNMLQDAGYRTMYSGKWQLDGGDAAIKNFGFEDYCVWLPYKVVPEADAGSRYKNPGLYASGKYLSPADVNNKYGEDIFVDSIFRFMERNINHPFFVYYSMNLLHQPFSPTPDDKEFANWVPDHSNKKGKFFPSMVKYMDKKLGHILDATVSLNIDKETIVIFVGDNGTTEGVESLFNGQTVVGEKGNTTTYGTHVPMAVWWPGRIMPGVNNDLIDFTDFLPTFAGMANISVPNYGVLDGVSFYPRLIGGAGTPRDWIFCQYSFDTLAIHPPSRWVQDKSSKLYEDGGYYHPDGFYDLTKDILEKSPIPDNQLTSQQLATKEKFEGILNTLK